MSNQYGTAQIVTDGLVLCLDAADGVSYPGSGNTWYDLTGHDDFVTSSGTPTFSSNPDRLVYDVIYATNVLGASVPAAWQGDQECTIDMWYYMDTPHTACCDTVFGRSYFRFFQINTNLYTMIGFDDSGLYYQHPSFVLASDTWHHCVGVRRGDDYIIWIDGVERYNTTFGIGLPLMGSTSQNYYVNMDHADTEFSICRMWNRGLSDAEILLNYNAQRTRFGK
jgi:hypothetical protein